VANLYGVTNSGGNANAGVLFEYNLASGVYTKRVDFSSSVGVSPVGGLLRGSNGHLYGVTSSGGGSSSGTLYEYNIGSNTFLKKADFDASKGTNPNGELIELSSTGRLYGFTRFGGTNNLGTLFEYNISNSTFTTIYSLERPVGANPQFGALAVNLINPFPDLKVTRNETEVTNNTTVAFPTAATAPASITFTIKNDGVSNLTLGASTPVLLSGADAASFNVTQPASTTLAPGASTTFSVAYTSTTSSVRTATLSIASNDPDTNPFTLTLKGASQELYGPQFPPIGGASATTTGEAGRPGGRKVMIQGVSLATRTTTYWGP